MTDYSASQLSIIEVCDEIKALLVEKNRKYGDSAINPVRIFSKSDAIEQINVRIDDKLNRKKNQQEDEDEDVDLDLIGYLVLKRVWNKLNEKKDPSLTFILPCDSNVHQDRLFPPSYYKNIGF